MINCDILIVGGQGAGLSAASEIRRFDSSLSILILETSKYISFSNCGIPLFLTGEIEFKDLIYYTKEDFEGKKNIKILTGVKVLSVNNYKREVIYSELENNIEKRVKFSKLLLAVGGTPIFPFKGNFKRCFVVRGGESALRLEKFIKDKSPKNVLIVGGGMVGLEIAEAMYKLNIKTVIFEKNQMLPKLPLKGRELILEKLAEREILVKEGIEVGDISETESNVVVKVNGREEKFDFLIFATGIVPGTNFIEFEPELNVSSNGAILVDEFLQSSYGNIYGAGDCILIKNIDGKSIYNPSGQLANITGRIAGRNIVGIYSPFFGSLNVTKIKVFDLEMGWCGMCEESSSVKKISTTCFSHPKYVNMGKNKQFLDIYFNFIDKKIVGASISGYFNVFSSIDLISMVIFNGGKVEKYFSFETGYTPKGDNSLNVLQQILLNIEEFF